MNDMWTTAPCHNSIQLERNIGSFCYNFTVKLFGNECALIQHAAYKEAFHKMKH